MLHLINLHVFSHTHNRGTILTEHVNHQDVLIIIDYRVYRTRTTISLQVIPDILLFFFRSSARLSFSGCRAKSPYALNANAVLERHKAVTEKNIIQTRLHHKLMGAKPEQMRMYNGIVVVRVQSYVIQRYVYILRISCTQFDTVRVAGRVAIVGEM